MPFILILQGQVMNALSSVVRLQKKVFTVLSLVKPIYFPFHHFRLYFDRYMCSLPCGQNSHPTQPSENRTTSNVDETVLCCPLHIKSPSLLLPIASYVHSANIKPISNVAWKECLNIFVSVKHVVFNGVYKPCTVRKYTVNFSEGKTTKFA